MSYKQLIEGQRYQILSYLQLGLNQSDIARRLCVHRSTICRELNRNANKQNYCPKEASQKAQARRVNAVKRKVHPLDESWIVLCLEKKWSPEQISGVGKRIGLSVSHEWIYRYISQDKQAGGKLYKSLRQGHKRYRRGKNTKRPVIPNRIGIEDRPAIVNDKSRLGDWEIDTVLGKHGTGAIVTIAERKSKLYILKKVPAKTAKDVAHAVVNMLWRYRKYVHTITADNGSEFCDHAFFASKLKAQVYFARPYASWERGLNENFNGLLRQYIRKGIDLRTISDQDLKRIEKELNERPRKCLGFRSPAIVFNELSKVT